MVEDGQRKRELVLATRNRGKVAEITQLLSGLNLHICSLLDLEESLKIEESGSLYSENALIKAISVHQATGAMALGEDSGLEIDAMQGGPGINSARYGGPELTDSERNALILRQMRDVPHDQRGARFVCVAVLVDEKGQAFSFQGTLEGYIGEEAHGQEGFGYDPIFCPAAMSKSLAQLGIGEKNRISHRAKAVKQVCSFLSAA